MQTYYLIMGFVLTASVTMIKSENMTLEESKEVNSVEDSFTKPNIYNLRTGDPQKRQKKGRSLQKTLILTQGAQQVVAKPNKLFTAGFLLPSLKGGGGGWGNSGGGGGGWGQQGGGGWGQSNLGGSGWGQGGQSGGGGGWGQQQMGWGGQQGGGGGWGQQGGGGWGQQQQMGGGGWGQQQMGWGQQGGGGWGQQQGGGGGGWGWPEKCDKKKAKAQKKKEKAKKKAQKKSQKGNKKGGGGWGGWGGNSGGGGGGSGWDEDDASQESSEEWRSLRSTELPIHISEIPSEMNVNLKSKKMKKGDLGTPTFNARQWHFTPPVANNEWNQRVTNNEPDIFQEDEPVVIINGETGTMLDLKTQPLLDESSSIFPENTMTFKMICPKKPMIDTSECVFIAEQKK